MLTTTLEYHALLVLPLWALAVTFPGLLPLAITSMLLPSAVCIVAAVQAYLPKDKTRWWSRPLVTLLFFLQPIVRGWARYQGRLRLQTVGGAVRESLDSVAYRDSGERLDLVEYWSRQRLDRFQCVAAILKQLDQQGWPNRPDIGWGDCDVEIQGNRWCQLQLTTVVEEHAAGIHLLRCRLRGRWSLSAKVAFWSLLGVDLVVIGFGNQALPWLWLLLLTVPLFFWFLVRQLRNLQSVVVVFLDALAKEQGLVRVKRDKATGRLVPASQA
jgi:hypothetical protein